MKEQIKKIAYFLHIVDDENQLDLTDLAFICIVIKVMISSNLDWPSVMVLATTCINKMHRRQQSTTVPQDIQQVKQEAQQLKDVQAKVEPIIEKIKENFS